MLTAVFSPEAECRELADEFAESYAVDEMPYEEYDHKEAMSKLEKLDKGIAEFEDDLEKAACNP